jgi:hypothetical protein
MRAGRVRAMSMPAGTPAGRSACANGTVMEFERPMRITFHQPMTMKLHLGTVDVLMR